MLLTPTYINVLNVYAFCNTHDVSWGTKGDDKPAQLKNATVGDDGELKVTCITDPEKLDERYREALGQFNAPVPKTKTKPKKSQEDFYRNSRTHVVLFWMFSNFALCGVVLKSAELNIALTDSQRQEQRNFNAKVYMSVILWSVAGMAFVRFLGAIWYRVVRVFRGV